MPLARFNVVGLAIVAALLCAWATAPVRALEPDGDRGVRATVTDRTDSEAGNASNLNWISPASWLQPLPFLPPVMEIRPETVTPAVPLSLSTLSFGLRPPPAALLTSDRRRQAGRPSADVIFGRQAPIRVSTDGGHLLGKSPAALGTQIQRRSPIVADPRVRGSRVGRMAASGSHWIPARLDLDSTLSKIDSRIIDNAILINGPYSAQHGPGFEFVDVQLLGTPRFEDGFELHGNSAFDYRANGEQFSGRQQVWGGGDEWGFRIGYGHRTGNDYRTGNGHEIPASYNSRDLYAALGFELTADSQLEVSYLRLDQTNLELPGQAFDIDFLVTDGWEVRYELANQQYADLIELEGWYNRTRFEGSAQRPGKRRQFPFYDVLNFTGTTDVDSMSSGYRAGLTWGDADTGQLTVGADLRYTTQELNEISSGRSGLSLWTDANSPIPDSYSGNPGIFVETVTPLNVATTLTIGARADTVSTNVTDDPAKLAALGLEVPQHSLAQILGTSEFDQSFDLLAGFVAGRHEITGCWSASVAGGYAERAPNLTELYAAQPFMFLLQNGLNTVTGDPDLARERRWQFDIGTEFRGDVLRAGARGFHAWALDYVTFEATRVLVTSQVEQVSLQFVNTELATFAGGEAYAELDLTPWLTPFATLQYVEGRDQTRDGGFATRRASGLMAKQRVAGLSRGFFGGISGSAREPLPGISPLESRLGFRLQQASDAPQWTVEFSARIVDNQDRVASSLLETPTPGFAVFDIRGYWQASPCLAVIAGVENLADRNYREHLDFRSENGIQVFQPGISFYAGLDASY